jgi:pilus assembly protein CpaF
MVISGNPNLPLRFVRAQIVNAVNMVVQIARMRDGVRRVIEVVEIAGVEGEVVVTQELFKFHAEASEPGGPINGRFVSSGLRPLFMDRAREYGFGEEVEALIAQD